MDVVTYAPIGQYLSKYAYREDRIAGILKVSDTILLERTSPKASSNPLTQSTRTVIHGSKLPGSFYRKRI